MTKKVRFLRPEVVVKEFNLSEGDTVIDYGSGSGFWSLEMAKIVGSAGEVFAVDARTDLLARLKKISQEKGISNIKTVLITPDQKKIPIDRKANLILFSPIFSVKLTDKEIIRLTREHSFTETKLVIIEWDKQSDFGPRKEHRLSEEELILEAKQAGFVFKKLLEAGKHHFGLYFEKEG